MATNVQLPGFYPSESNLGGGSVQYVRRRALTNGTQPIACQDAVKADSSADLLGLGTTSTFATAVDGVSMGASYIDAGGARISRPNLPGSTAYTSTGVDPVNATYLFVTEGNDNIKYICSIDTAMALTNLRNNFDINLAPGVNGYSQQELRAASAATTSTLPFRLVEFVFAGDNIIDSGAHVHVKAMINIGQSEPDMTANTGL